MSPTLSFAQPRLTNDDELPVSATQEATLSFITNWSVVRSTLYLDDRTEHVLYHGGVRTKYEAMPSAAAWPFAGALQILALLRATSAAAAEVPGA